VFLCALWFNYFFLSPLSSTTTGSIEGLERGWGRFAFTLHLRLGTRYFFTLPQAAGEGAGG
jgi:hypothetical protein